VPCLRRDDDAMGGCFGRFRLEKISKITYGDHVATCPAKGQKADITGNALSSPRWHVAKDIVSIADEDNPVPSWIATVPFDLGIGNCKTPSVLDVTATKGYVVACVSDDGDILMALHLIAVGPISIRQPTAAQVRLVWPHQLIEPLAM
jgi:hypothetical protein